MAEEQRTSLTLPRQFQHEYNCWKAMRSRCTKPTNPSWKYYGERGIQVCQRWIGSFAAFITDMGAAPTAEHQIDRIRNEDNYEPSNCQWATPREQAANTSKVVYVTYNGVTLSVTDWAAIFGTNVGTLRDRVIAEWDTRDVLFDRIISEQSTNRKNKARLTPGVRHPASGKFVG